MTTQTTTLRADFVSESAGYHNTFGWYNKTTGKGGILFADIEAQGHHPTVTPGVSSVEFTVDTADVGNIAYFLIPNGGDIRKNSDAELSGAIKVIRLADGSWAVATVDQHGNVEHDRHGKPNILYGEDSNAFFTETSKNAGGVDYASSTAGKHQTAATLAGDTTDGPTGLIAWEDLAAKKQHGHWGKPGDADYNDAVFRVSIVDQNQAPTDIALSDDAVDENSANGTIVAALTTTDPDAGETFTYQLLDDAGGRFAIVGTNIVVAGALDYESATSHSVTIRVTDSANNTYDEVFTINVNNVSGLIIGDDTPNVLTGTSEEDTIQGLGGNDVLIGGVGPDLIDGGDGLDFASYITATTGVTASLANPAINTGDAAGDTYVSIERLEGTIFNDVLFGDAGSNGLTGGAGADVLNGGDEIDFAGYSFSTTGLIVDLLTPANNTGEAVGDTYISIEGIVGSAFDDQLFGDNFNSILEGGAGADLLNGRGGSDSARYQGATVGVTASLANPGINTGDAAGDVYVSIENLIGSEFDDVLIGNSLNNFLQGRLGADVLDGGAGFDTADYVRSASGLTADLSNPANNTGEAAGDSYISIEHLRGSAFDDILVGNSANNILTGIAGADQLFGGAGFDTADYFFATSGLTADLSNPANNTGEAAGDTYASIENLRGTNFADTLIGDAGSNVLTGAGGADTLIGGLGIDMAAYDAAPTGLVADLANPANNTGDAAGDTYDSIEQLAGTNFNDTLTGDGTDNFLAGNAGVDNLFGGAGSDKLEGGAGADALHGGDGHDYATYFGATAGVTADLSNPLNNTGIAAGDSYDSIEAMNGSNFNDVLVANDSGIDFNGGSGNDTLIGGAGSDFIEDSSGDDRLIGRGGNDFLQDFSGNNTYVFADGDGADVINGFIAGAGSEDVIEFQGGLFADFAAVLAASQEVDGQVEITYGSGNTVTFSGLLANLHQDDFLLL